MTTVGCEVASMVEASAARPERCDPQKSSTRTRRSSLSATDTIALD
jgi:hypothetical protein